MAGNDPTLKISVKNLQELEKLKDLLGALVRLGPALKGDFANSTKQAADSLKAFANLSSEMKTGFAAVTSELQKISASYVMMRQEAKTGAAEIAASIDKQIEKTEKLSGITQKLRRDKQAAYNEAVKQNMEAQTLVGVANPVAGLGNSRNLRLMSGRGVVLTPDDAASLQAQRLSFQDQKRGMLEAKKDAESLLAWRLDMQTKRRGFELRDAALTLERAKMERDQLLVVRKQARADADADAAGDLRRKTLQRGQDLGEGATLLARAKMERDQLLAVRKQAREDADADERVAAKGRRLNSTFDAVSPDAQNRRVSGAMSMIGQPGGSAREASGVFGSTATALAMERLAQGMSVADSNATKLGGTVRAMRPAMDQHRVAVLQSIDAYDGLHASVRGLAGGFGQMWLTWGKPLLALWAGFAVSSGIRESVQQFAEFQDVIARTAAVGMTSEKSIRALSETALRLGTEGIKGPLEIAQGLKILTQAGLQTSEALAQVGTVAKFATVGEMTMAASAQSLVGITSAFGLSTSEMGRVADTIAKAAAISQTSIEGMTAAVKVSSTVAEQFGVKIEDVSTFLAVLAKRNIDFTSAGTAFRNMVNELYTPSAKAEKALKQLGISAYDSATGMRKGLIPAMEEVRAKIIEFDAKGQDKIFDIVFGERGGKPGSAFLSSIEEFKRISEEARKSAGFVSQAAFEIEGSLKSQAIIALNGLRAAFIEAGQAAEPAMQQVVKVFQGLFADPAFTEGLKTFMLTFANLTIAVVENAGTIARAVELYVGLRIGTAVLGAAASIGSLIGAFGLAGVAGATMAVANSRSALSFSAISASASSAAVATAANAAAATADTLATVANTTAKTANTVASGGMLGSIASGVGVIGRFIPQLALLTSAIWFGSEAWDAYKKAKSGAVPDSDISTSEVDRLKKTLEDERKKTSDMRVSFFEGRAPDENITAIDRMIAKQTEEVSRKTSDWQRRNINTPLNDYVGEERSRLNGLLELRKQFEEETKEQQSLSKRMEEFRASQIALRTGTKKFELEKTPKTGRSYTHPLSTEIGSETSLADTAVRAAEKEFAREKQRLDNSLKLRIVTEEQYTELYGYEVERRARLEVEALKKLLDVDLPDYNKKRLADINKRFPKGADGREEQLAAFEADKAARKARAEENLKSAQEQATLDRESRSATDFDKGYKRDQGLQTVVRDLNLDEEKKQMAANEQFMTAAEIAVQQARLHVKEKFAEQFKKAETSLNQDYVDSVKLAYDAASEFAEASAVRRIAAENSFQTGVKKGLLKIISDNENMAKSGEQLVGKLAGGVDDFFANMAKGGKANFKDMINSMLSDLARFASQKYITGPLAKALFGSMGSADGGFFDKLFGSAPLTGTIDAGISSFTTAHNGGMAGYEHTGMRSVSSSAFLGANRYHTGGIVGNEVPIIAQRGEGVFTPGQMAAIGKGPAGAPASAPEITVNVINNGSQQQTATTETRFDGNRMIINVVLEDMKRNGPIAQGMKAMR